MASSIICGIDGSAHARAALEVAAALAERLRLRLVLVHAVPAPTPDLLLAAPVRVPAGVEHIDLLGHDAGARLLAQAAETHGLPAADRRLEDGRPAERLAAVARDEHAELLVVGSRGAGSLHAAVLGSVSTSVVRNAPCPVVVVPPNLARPPRARERIVCGVQSAQDLPAVLAATQLSRRLHAPLTITHVLPPATDADLAPAGALPSSFELRLEAGSRRALQIVHRLLRDAGSDLDERLHHVELRHGHPADELLRLAASTHAMLLVVGSRGLRPLRGGLLGSVSRELVRRATRPVVICRQQEQPE
jgi:nucleotide-binding universal stress UspA family protein